MKNNIPLRTFMPDNFKSDFFDLLNKVDHSLFGIEVGVNKYNLHHFIITPPHLVNNQKYHSVGDRVSQFKDFNHYEGYLSQPYFLPLRFDLNGHFEKCMNTLKDELEENEDIIFIWLFKKGFNWKISATEQYKSYLNGNDNPANNNILRITQDKLIQNINKISNIFEVNREYSEDVEQKILDKGFNFNLQIFIKSDRVITIVDYINTNLMEYDFHNGLRIKKALDMKPYQFQNNQQMLSLLEIESIFTEMDDNSEETITKQKTKSPTNEIVELLPYIEKEKENVDYSLIEKLGTAMKRVGLINQARLYDTTIESGSRLTIIQANIPPNKNLTDIKKKQEDIQAEMGVQSLNIEQGDKAGTIKFSIPNDKQIIVSLREIIERKDFQEYANENNLAFTVGVDELNNPIYYSLSDFPHLLIAGANGSGKSVFINCLLITLLINHKPDELQMYLIDPKQVELNLFKPFPHVKEVVTNMNKASSIFQSLVKEMNKRYEKFSEVNVRNIKDYNKKLNKKMPYLMFVVDEVSNLMSIARNDIEEYLKQLGNMARASGIHIILATQRPDSKIISGAIKANFQNAISFNLSNNTNYRTVFGEGIPYDKLLGNGDGVAKIEKSNKTFQRFQSPIIHPDSEEVERIYNELSKAMAKDHIVVDEIETYPPPEDELMHQLKSIIANTGETRVSKLREQLSCKSETLTILLGELVSEGWLIKHKSKQKGYELIADENILSEWRVH